ncbi:hypothetical protein HHI36_009532 [Cryptolaemus montrouzieri]|uniref:Uncharacterized protein n=1 Tax=Cryptolaemus montrouzieri TaxID=559131 RepID=A0ABD2MFZ4_9CUCU
MKFLIVFVTLATSALSAPLEGEQHVAVTQDTLGNYKYDILLHGFSKSEVGVEGGGVRGGYKYYDADGKLQSVEYTAGPGGYQATGTNLPVAPTVLLVPVEYTPEVLKARNEHLALF